MAPKYRRINLKFWTDLKVRRLDPLDKLVFLYLVTCRHSHLSGLYHMPVMYASHETGLDENGINRAFSRLTEMGLIQYDCNNEVMLVVNMLKYQVHSESTMIAVRDQMESLHDCPLIAEFIGHYDTLLTQWEHCMGTVVAQCLGSGDKIKTKIKTKTKIKNPISLSPSDPQKEIDGLLAKCTPEGKAVLLRLMETFQATRKTNKIQPKVLLSILERLSSYGEALVKQAFDKYLPLASETKDEKYFFGILKNLHANPEPVSAPPKAGPQDNINPRSQWRDPETKKIWTRIDMEDIASRLAADTREDRNHQGRDLLERARKDRLEWDWSL